MTVEVDSTDLKRKREENDEESTAKQVKLTPPPIELTPETLNETKLTKRELLRIEKQRQRETERLEKEKKKIEEKKRKEDERLKKQQLREQEKQLKKKQLEDERAEKERKKELERLDREKKKEQERLKKQQEKDEREQARLEKKKKLEEEKESKELERRKLEDEKKRKEEERAKSQKKISSFFTVKKLVPSEPQATPALSQLVETETTDYEKDFLPFFIQKNMQLFDMGQLSRDKLSESKARLDEILIAANYDKVPALSDFFKSKQTSPALKTISITPDDVVTALNSSTSTEAQIYEMISKFPPLKFISFYENSKPAYIGTWCSIQHQKIEFSPINPLDTSLTGFDYEYDSDLEWNKDDEEGEDVDNEDEEDEEDILEDADDLGFVEDDQPNDQGIKFHSLNVVMKINDGTNDEFFRNMLTKEIGELLLPLDPFATATAVENPETTKNNNTNKQKPIIDDKKIVCQLIKFFDSSDLTSFSLNTILELAMKHIEFPNKSLMRNTLHHILKKDRQTLAWSIKEDTRKEYA